MISSKRFRSLGSRKRFYFRHYPIGDDSVVLMAFFCSYALWRNSEYCVGSLSMAGQTARQPERTVPARPHSCWPSGDVIDELTIAIAPLPAFAATKTSICTEPGMSDKDYALTMARYNLWQNESILAAAGGLSSAERERERGAFFGSIQKTLSHIFWADQVWLSRFTGSAAPEGGIPGSVKLIGDWETFRVDRQAFDRQILEWAHNVEPDWFEGELSWHSGALGRKIAKPKKTLVIQLFNHQTHHRGQIHAMLTAAGATPEATDVPFMPDRFLCL